MGAARSLFKVKEVSRQIKKVPSSKQITLNILIVTFKMEKTSKPKLMFNTNPKLSSVNNNNGSFTLSERM